MTQAAVSYQIRQLEDRIGAPLFHRQPRGVELTETGSRFATTVREALNLLRSGYAEASAAITRRLLISSMPSFAVSILASRLGAFHITHPEISIRLDMAEEPRDLHAAGEPIIALRYGREHNEDGLIAHRLMPFTFSPMLSPDLLERYGPLNHPRDLLKLPRIMEYDAFWHGWFNFAGVKHRDETRPTQDREPFNMLAMSANAAIAGTGVSMLPPNFVRDELARGALVQPFDLEFDFGWSIWMIYAERYRRNPAIRAFSSWLIKEMQRDFGETTS